MTDAAPPTAADVVTDATMAPMDDAAGGPTADSTDRDETEEPDAEEAAAQLGDFA